MKLHKNCKNILKSYSFISLAANAAIAISISGLAVLGVLSSSLAFPMLAGCAIFLGAVGAVGRFIDQGLDEGRGKDEVCTDTKSDS